MHLTACDRPHVTNLGFARTSSTSSSALTRSFIGAQPLTCASDFDLVARNAVRPRSVVFADTSRRGRGSTTKSATPEWRRRRQRRANWCGTWSNRVAAIPRPRRSTPFAAIQAHHGAPTGPQATRSEPYVPFESFHEKSRTVERGTPAVPPLRVSKPLAVHLPPEPPKASPTLARMASPRTGARLRRRRPVGRSSIL